jgi:hypothetical protein
MSGRRGHQRLTISGPTNGAVRVLRDVVIERMRHHELVTISQTPAAIGEEMFMELFSGNGCVALKVRVLDSRPVVISGSMRHRLRLLMVTAGVPVTPSDRGPLAESPTTPENA